MRNVVFNMFKVNTKDTKTMSMNVLLVSLLLTLNRFYTTFAILSKFFFITLNRILFAGKYLRQYECSHFTPPENTRRPHQKTFAFLVFSGVIKWEHWSELGQN